MCGIIGYLGKKEALPIVLEGLKRMEYRGYDSAGVAVLSSVSEKQPLSSVICVKAKGKVIALKEKSSAEKIEGMVGIGHTRWATHGEPSERNAHPHQTVQGIFLLHIMVLLKTIKCSKKV